MLMRLLHYPTLCEQFDMLPGNGMWQFDVTTSSVWLSNGACGVLGCKTGRAALTSQEFLQLFNQASQATLQAQIQQAVATGSRIALKGITTSAQAAGVQVAVTGAVNYNEAGQPQTIEGVLQALTQPELLQANEKNEEPVTRANVSQASVDKASAGLEEKYDFLLANSPGIMIVWDFETLNIVDVNDVAVATYGYTRQEFLQLNIKQIRPPEDIPLIEDATKSEATYGPKHNTVWRHLKKNGELMYVQVNARLFTYKGRLFSINNNIDVTEKEQALKLLSKQQEQLSLIFNAVNDVIFVLGVENNQRFWFQSVNASFTRVTGVQSQQVIGANVADVIPQPSLSIALNNYAAAINTKRSITWEETSTYPAGIITGIVTVSPVFNSQGICTQLIGSVADITAQKAIQTTLQQRNLFIETAMDNLPIGIAVNSISEGTTTLINRKFSEIYGWPVEELTDLISFFERVYPDKQYREQIVTRIMTDIESRNPTRMVWENVIVTTSTGEKRIVNAKNIPLYQQDLMISTVVDVTETVKAQNSLKLSNERFEYAARATMDALWDWDLENKTLFWGQPYADIFGHSMPALHEALDLWKQNLHPNDQARVIHHIYAVIDGTGNNWEDEYRYRKANNEYAYVIDKGFVIRDANGKAIRMVGSMRDVTKNKEEELRLKLLESVITNANDAVLITKAEPFNQPGPRIVYVNDAFTRMTGYTPDEVIGKTPRILQGPQSDKAALAEMGRKMRNWESCGVTTINYKKNGEPFWINFNVSPVADATGWYTHWIAIERDVTEQKRAESVLRAAYDERNDILESIGDCFFAMDKNYVVTYWNKQAEIVMKKKRGDVVGRSLKEVYPPHVGRISYEYYEKAMAGQKVQYFEIYNEEVETWFDVSVFPASGGGLSIYFRNITERVKHQRAIEAKNKKLSEIAWMQSHVVRAPLSTMMGLINLIQNNDISLEEKESLIAHLVTAAHELDKIIAKIAYETYKAKTT